MSKPTEVYLVEDHTDPGASLTTRYWAHVYLSRARAKAGVELYAGRGGHGPVQWREHSPVSYAFAADSSGECELYRVVPLEVRPDDKPDP